MANSPLLIAATLFGRARLTVNAVVTRADGTVEDFGVVYDSSPIWLLKRAGRRLLAKLSQIFGKDR